MWPPHRPRPFRRLYLRERLSLLTQDREEGNSGRYDKCISSLERILSFSVDDGLDLYATAQLVDALSHFDCGVPTEERWERMLSLSDIVLSRFEEFCSFADFLFLRSPGHDPTAYRQSWSERIRLFKGNALFQQEGRTEEAIWFLTESIELSPVDIWAYCHRALCFCELNQNEDALKDVDAAESIATDPNLVSLITEFGRHCIPKIPSYRAMVLANRADCSVVQYSEALTTSTVEARNSGLVCWKGRPNHISDNGIRLEERELRKSLEGGGPVGRANRSFFTSIGGIQVHRSTVVSLESCRTRLDSIVEFYANSDRLSNNESTESCSMMALFFSDSFKTFSFAGSFDFRTVNEVGPTSETLIELSGDDSAVICYHLIPSVPGSSSEVVIRWVIVSGVIVQFDSVNCSNLLQKGSTLMSLVSSLRNPQSVIGKAFAGKSTSEERNSAIQFQRRCCCVLYDVLIRGLEPFIPSNVVHVTFVPDSFLFRVPFACLMESDSEIFLIELYSLSISCSLWMMQKNAEQKETVVLDSLLPRKGSRTIHAIVCEGIASPRHASKLGGVEVFRVTRCLGREDDFEDGRPCIICLRDNHFSPEAFESVCSDLQPRFIHVVSHGSAFDPKEVQLAFESDLLYEFDMKGSLQCSGSEPLLARAVAEMNLRGTDLVYLSCCSLGDGELKAGSVLGFYRACFVAGCPSVICSLWPVASGISTRLSILFYTALRSGRGLDKAGALRRAVLQLMAASGTREENPLKDHPLLWATFQLFGSRL